MTPNPTLQQLYILRAQLDLLIALQEGVTTEVGCPHPEDKRRAAHNMGEEPAFLCLACGQTVLGVA